MRKPCTLVHRYSFSKGQPNTAEQEHYQYLSSVFGKSQQLMGNRFSIEGTIGKWRENEEYSVLLLGTSLQIKRCQYGEVRVASRRSRDHQVSRADGSLEGILLDLENMRRKILTTPDKSEIPETSPYHMSNLECEIYNVWSQQRDQGKRYMFHHFYMRQPC